MHPELQEAINLHDAIIAEASKALVGYDTEKALANIVLLSEIPTTYDKKQNRQVNVWKLRHGKAGRSTNRISKSRWPISKT